MIQCTNCGKYNEAEFITDIDCIICGRERFEREQKESFLSDKASQELEEIREYTERWCSTQDLKYFQLM